MFTEHTAKSSVRSSRTVGLFCLILSCFVGLSAFGAEATKSFSIAAGPAETTLKKFAEQSGRSVIFAPEKVKGVTTNEVKGDLPVDQALDQLLSETKLSAVPEKATGGFAIRREATVEIAEKNASSRPASDRAADGSQIKDGVLKLDTFEVFGKKTLNMDIARTRDDPQPYVIFDSETIEKSGATSLDDFFKNRLPMNTTQAMGDQVAGLTSLGNTQSQINLRGLGSSQTLILIDGRRYAGAQIGSADFSQTNVMGIPLSAVERIEVLPSTAGGIYGGSATGGVINIILKRKYSGFELRASYANTFDTDVGERRIELSGGLSFNDGKTNLMLSLAHQDRNQLLIGDRNFAIRARLLSVGLNGGVPNPGGGTLPQDGLLTNIMNSVANTNLVLKNGTALNSAITYVPANYAGPATDGGVALVANQGKQSIAPPNDTNGALGSLFANTKSDSGLINLRHRFSTWLEVFAEVASERLESRQKSNGTSIDFFALIPATASNNPFTTAIWTRFPIIDPAQDFVAKSGSDRFVFGAIFSLPGRWKAELDYAQNRTQLTNQLSVGRGDPDGAGPGISVSTALTNGTLDVLRDLNKYPLDYGPYRYRYPGSIEGPYRTKSATVGLRAGGPVYTLPAGEIVLSSVVEHASVQKDGTSYSDAIATFSNPAGSSTIFPAGAKQQFQAYYVEAAIPIIAPKNRITWANKLDLQVSGRRDDYTTDQPSPNAIGVPLFAREIPATTPVTISTNKVASTSYTISLSYSPTADFALRGSYATGFLPPNITQLNISHNTTFAGTVLGNDPKRGNTAINYAVPFDSGGNPNLKPEESTAESFGLVYSPSYLKGLRLSIDYTRVNKVNEIAFLNGQTILNLEDILPGRVVRQPLGAGDAALGYTGGLITFMDSTLVNLAGTKMEAIDYQADFSWKTKSVGDLQFYAVATNARSLQRRTLPTLPFVEVTGFTDGPLKWRGNLGLNWRKGQWSAGWNTQYFGKYLVYSSTASAATKLTLITQGIDVIPRQIYHDVFASYRFSPTAANWTKILTGTEITVGVQNLFNTSPTIISTFASLSSYSQYGDPRLQRYRISFKKAF